ncbi:hypothetical protein DBT_0230 [Dissulfuribacter thermophilus]|uniref:Lipoprotein n=1 Tax=Dissulfuribacter thermophilus TaxID=1156395 RepID=A0A1B9F932_9BACT|nr:hypothetical protein [Dissulfuribacter thermophilus]OCC16413.1 hypothetical protein DBT_0230 [Dissulfuribacter thermophilus]
MKKQNLFLSVLIFCVFLISGCGSKVIETVSPLTPPVSSDTSGISIAILPLADYTNGYSIDDAARRQIKLETAISYELTRLGIYPALQEDVIQCLSDIGVIKIIETPEVGSSQRFIQRELSSGWSDEMRMEVQKILASNRGSSRWNTIKTKKIGLDPGTLMAIGQRLGVDYVLRGRIVEYEIRDDRNLNPLQRGILPFFFDLSSATVFGVARSDTYDLWHDVSVGGLLGAVFGSSANHPFNAPSKKTSILNDGHPRLGDSVVSESGGFDGSHGLNAAFWGAAGAGAAYLAYNGGKVPEAVVQVTLALQDVHTGKVLWANRVEKMVQPKSVWSDTSVRTQVDLAVEEAAKSLVQGLAKVLESLTREASKEHFTYSFKKTPSFEEELKVIPKVPETLEEKTGELPEEWGS